MNASTPRLEIRNLSLAFSGVQALKDISFSATAGSLTSIIGPNGAGKTSLFNCISGLVEPQSGVIRLDGKELKGADDKGLEPHDRAAFGVARMFQNLALYEHLSVVDNLLVGRHHLFKQEKHGWLQDLFWMPSAKAAEVAHRRRVEEIIDFLHLEAVRKSYAGVLPYGVLKRVELGRALCMEPKLLLLDEPAAGLNQEETEDMARFILDVKEELGITILLIEHDLHLVMDLADRVVVLDFGQMLTEGTPEEVRDHPEVIRAYTGSSAPQEAP